MLPTHLNDAELVFDEVPPKLDHVTAAGVLWEANRTQFLLEVPGVARYFVEAGLRVTVQEFTGSSRDDVARVARTTPLAALVWQRGALALHAAVAVKDDGALLVAGDSCAGKSALLAALLARGWRMLSDDMAIVRDAADGTPTLLPIAAELALWPDVLAWLGPRWAPVPGSELVPPDDEHDTGPNGRAVLSVAGAFVDDPQPLRGIFWLTTSHRDGVEIVELSGLERFQAVATLAYNSRIASATCERSMFLRSAEAVSRSAPLLQVRRPRGRWTVSDLADAVGGAVQ